MQSWEVEARTGRAPRASAAISSSLSCNSSAFSAGQHSGQAALCRCAGHIKVPNDRRRQVHTHLVRHRRLCWACALFKRTLSAPEGAETVPVSVTMITIVGIEPEHG